MTSDLMAVDVIVDGLSYEENGRKDSELCMLVSIAEKKKEKGSE